MSFTLDGERRIWLMSGAQEWVLPTGSLIPLMQYARGAYHLKVARCQHAQLIHTFLGLLVADVFSDDRFVSPYGRDQVAACPEVLPDEVALSFAKRACDVNPLLYPTIHATDHFGGIERTTAARPQTI